jgi:hypothetical protein
MTAKTKTKAQLVIELAALQQRVTELEVELRQREVELEHWLAAERENWALSEALNQTGAAIGSSLRGEEVLDHILEEMSRVVACDAACLLLIEEDIAPGVSVAWLHSLGPGYTGGDCFRCLEYYADSHLAYSPPDPSSPNYI